MLSAVTTLWRRLGMLALKRLSSSQQIKLWSQSVPMDIPRHWRSPTSAPQMTTTIMPVPAIQSLDMETFGAPQVQWFLFGGPSSLAADDPTLPIPNVPASLCCLAKQSFLFWEL